MASCTPCQKRRQMLADAKKAQGLKGIAKVLPAVAHDVVRNPPRLVKGNRNG